MRCKVFKIPLEDETGESEINEFLAAGGVDVKQVFASTVGDEGSFWSVLLFYEEEESAPATDSPARREGAFLDPEGFRPSARALTNAKTSEQDAAERAIAAAANAALLTLEQEEVFNRLKKWRNDRAAQDGVPPYMIANNESLRLIAAQNARDRESLLQVKGFGEKRLEKYGDELLEILAGS